MKKKDSSILKIYASSTDKIGSELFYEHIVYLAKNNGIAGVTVFRGIMGYGLTSKISSSKFWELTEKLPVIIEIIDSTEILHNFYDIIESDLRKMTKGCLVTIEPISIKLHLHGTLNGST